MTAVVASAASSGAAQAESRAVGLDMTQSLAVVALLRLSRARERAAVRLVAYDKRLLDSDRVIALLLCMPTRLLAYR